jgi:hypothetical protein
VNRELNAIFWLVLLAVAMGAVGCDYGEDRKSRLDEIHEKMDEEESAENRPAPAPEVASQPQAELAEPAEANDAIPPEEADAQSAEGPAIMFAHLPETARKHLSPLQRRIGVSLYEAMEVTAAMQGENAYGQRLIRDRIRERMAALSREVTGHLAEEGLVGWVGQIRFSSDGLQLTTSFTLGDKYTPPEASGRSSTGSGRVQIDVTYRLKEEQMAPGHVPLRDLEDGQWMKIVGPVLARSPEAVTIGCPLVGGRSRVTIPTGPEAILLYIARPAGQVPTSAKQAAAERSVSMQSDTTAAAPGEPPLEPTIDMPQDEATAPTPRRDDVQVVWSVPDSKGEGSLPENHPARRFSNVLLRVDTDADDATFGVGVGPESTARSDAAYREYKEQVGQAFMDAVEEINPTGLRADFRQELAGVTYDRWYVRRGQKVVTVLVTVQDGAAVSYWYVGDVGGWPAFRKSVGTATFTRK